MTDAPEKIRPAPVEIELVRNGKPWPLRLSYPITAALNINRKFGGLNPTLQRIGFVDLDAYAFIISEGAGVTDKARKDVLPGILEVGAPDLIEPLTRYVLALYSGGRKPKAEATDNDTSDDEADDPLG